ncbi:CobQ/CobB/MinD/ParA nucleotide binding domain protein [Pelotomaculum schinkii]|uniref:CobQ/CobB/MinD/ParA nucleotide binding domain protein n=1 Tax=Pelotomaculum schinkii TaxID=78350 RepID=A0A4Y7R7W3_9FIRM|nr:AAA family ATPase [Pelotomaculum schinkii]TEB04720.1 CobQ/CobB/MinD/ParA nucleotide binding domain protein [Pelotomaculum schinkii]
MIILCGDKEFTAAARAAFKGSKVPVSGIAATVNDLIALLESTGAAGVLMPAVAEWTENLVRLAAARKNAHFFVAGRVRKSVWDDLTEAGVVILSPDLQKAVRDMEMALERISPTGFRYVEGGEKVTIVQKRVDILTRTIPLVFSYKGGVGKTTTVANLAAATGIWARETEEETGKELRVAVIDNNSVGNLKYKFGFDSKDSDKVPRSLAGFAHLHPNSSLGAVLEAMNYHEPTNVYFVVSPETGYEKVRYNEGIFKLCLDLLQRHFHFVFIDMGIDLDSEMSILAANAATDIIVVTDRNQDTVNLIRDRRGEMGQVFGGFDRVQLVINNHKKENADIGTSAILRELNLPLAAELPYCTFTQKAVRKGVPAVALDSQDKYSISVSNLAQTLINVTGVGGHSITRSGRFIEYLKKLFKKG